MKKNLYKTAGDYSVELCRIVNPYVSKRTKDQLVGSCISFIEEWRRIPLWRRSDYNGFSKICILSINRNEYVKARRSLDSMDPVYKNRIQVNLI